MAKPIYVGGTSGGGTGASYAVSLTGLTGGIGSAPQDGDLILVFTGEANGASVTSTCSGNNSGAYSTNGAHQNQADTHDANLDKFFKRAGATPDTSLTITRGSNNTTYGSATVVQVWRGAHATNPFNVTQTTAASANSSAANPPAITPTATDSVIVYCGHASQLAASGTPFTAADTYPITLKNDGSTGDSIIMVAANTAWTSGAFDPAVFAGSTTATTLAWVAVTMVIQSADVSKTLTGAQVAAQAGTLTTSQALTRALTGAQVAASAGTLTASQAGPSPIIQEAYNVDDSGTGLSSLAVTLNGVTAGNAIVVFVGYNAGPTTVTVSDGTAYTESSSGVCQDTINAQDSRVFYLPNSSGGNKTITVSLSSSTPYVRIRAFEVSGLAASGIEDQSADQPQGTVGTGTDSISSSATAATTQANCVVLGLTQDTSANDPGTGTMAAGTGYTLIGSNQILAAEYKEVSATGAQTATFTDTKDSRRTTHVIAFKQATPGTVALTGEQVAASAGTVTASQALTRTLTGAQVAAQAGTVTASQQVSKTITGAQVAASAGTVTASQQVSKTLTGAQVAAQAGTLTTSQALTRALTGEQVAASAGTLTASQTTNDITLALTGAQVAASAGTVTASQAVSKTLTGAQVAASAGTVTASQQVSKTLTGAQVVASAGTVTASQQVSKTLTGAQVAASAGTVTASQSTNDITLALTGAQASTQAGSLAANREFFVSVFGAQAAAQAGTIATSQAVTRALTGAQAAALAGNLSAGAVQPLFVNVALTGSRVVALASRIGTGASSQYPSPANVRAGVTYGPTGVEFTGTMGAGGYSRGRVVNE